MTLHPPSVEEATFLDFVFLEAKVMKLLLLMAEIRRSPVEVGSLSHYLQFFLNVTKSQVVQDFFHQQ